MPGQGRLGDKAYVPQDVHGCLACPHPGSGPAISGSPGVFVNKRPALRVDDVGIHAACCGANTWRASTGSETVFIDGKAAHRQTDRTTHCGGGGQLVEGSPNVIVGDTTASPAAGAPRGTPASRGGSAGGGASASTGAPPGAAAPSSASGSPSAGSSTTAGQGPHQPPDVARADAIEPGVDLDPSILHVPAQAEALRVAAAAHVPFCAECERAKARIGR